jgi:hypothetical protein
LVLDRGGRWTACPIFIIIIITLYPSSHTLNSSRFVCPASVTPCNGSNGRRIHRLHIGTTSSWWSSSVHKSSQPLLLQL